jgi:ATP-dependent helicase/DNAse subunit B
VVTQAKNIGEVLGVTNLEPAGAFYVGLRCRPGTGEHRTQVKQECEESRRMGYQHDGRFRLDLLPSFDGRSEPKGDQFKYALKKDGQPKQKGNQALPPEEFLSLLEHVQQCLTRYGRAIYDGTIATDPYRLKSETACDRCRLGDICRFDRWTGTFRVLR